MKKAESVNVLGTEYKITWTKDPLSDCKLEGAMGYTEPVTKKLVIDDRPADSLCVDGLDQLKLKVLRHEIVHAFLVESGLDTSSPWARNEEMVDWVALQMPRMVKAMREVGAL